MRTTRHRTKAASVGGFTTVELLVVIGIIAVISAFLFPAIRRSRQKAAALACKSQLHGIGTSIQLYLHNNKGHYPLAPQLPSVNPNGYATIMTLLSPHNSGRADVFHCPSDELTFAQEQTSYFYNSELGITPMGQTFFYKVFRSTSLVPVMWDASNYHGGTVPFNWLFADGHVDEFLSPAK